MSGRVMDEPLRILVSGRIASTPGQGGATWAVLQYLIGLRELGHQVWFVEAIPAIDLLTGGDAIRTGIEAGAGLDELTARWPRDEGDFAAERAEYLLYE